MVQGNILRSTAEWHATSGWMLLLWEALADSLHRSEFHIPIYGGCYRAIAGYFGAQQTHIPLPASVYSSQLALAGTFWATATLVPVCSQEWHPKTSHPCSKCDVLEVLNNIRLDVLPGEAFISKINIFISYKMEQHNMTNEFKIQMSIL